MRPLYQVKLVDEGDFRQKLVIERNGAEIAEHYDCGEPEDQSFYRDWAWVPLALRDAYLCGVEDAMSLAEYDDWQHRLAFADDELKKLRAVAKAAGEYLNVRFWDEDEEVIEAAGEALAEAMNAWKDSKK